MTPKPPLHGLDYPPKTTRWKKIHNNDTETVSQSAYNKGIGEGNSFRHGNYHRLRK